MPVRIVRQKEPGFVINDVFNYIFYDSFQSLFNVIYVLFDLGSSGGFSLHSMSTLLTGDLIRAARALIGLSQVELAKKAGITQKALGEFELGKRPITARANEKLRRVFDDARVQFIAANIEAAHLEGAGVRWKPQQPNAGIKTI